MSNIPTPDPVINVVEIQVPAMPGPPGPPGNPGGLGPVKGLVANTGLLPATGNTQGDIYQVGTTPPYALYFWMAVGSTWNALNTTSGPAGPAGPPGTTLLPPTWKPIASFGSGWVPSSAPLQPVYAANSLNRIQLRGQLTYVGGNPPDNSLILTMPVVAPSIYPTTPRVKVAIELSVPGRIYLVSLGVDGTVRLKSPLLNSTGVLCLDPVSWVL